jgi:hypothetical protein
VSSAHWVLGYSMGLVSPGRLSTSFARAVVLAGDDGRSGERAVLPQGLATPHRGPGFVGV